MKCLNQLHETLQAPLLKSDAAVPVLVLKLGRLVLHHGGVGIIRSLGRMGVPVYSLVEDRFTPAACSRYLTGLFVWDPRGLDAQQLVQGMDRIGERLNRPTILISVDDVGASFIAEHAAALQRWFLFPQQPAPLPRTLANKRLLYLLCKRIGVACPETVFPSSIDDVHEFIDRAIFPVVVKASASWLFPEGARTTCIARTPEQVYAIYRIAERREGQNVIFQEYIPAACSEDWFYHGYHNVRSDCRVGYTGRKLRSYPAFAGPTTLGKAIDNERLRQEAQTLLQTISYSGIMDLDYRLDKRDGQYKLLDFNPRIGAQFRLFEDNAGLDVARALYLDLTGRRVLSSRPIQGRTFIADFHDFAAALCYFREGKLTLRDWWLSLKGTREWAWLSRDDPFPCLMMFIRLLFRVVERILRITPPPKMARRVPCYGSGLSAWRKRQNLLT
jgi:D-aspartate ligase